MKTMTTVALLLVVIAGAALADQPTDAKLEAARKALNAERYKEAAALYAEAYQLAGEQAVAGDALYWEAFSRYRLQQTLELKQALKLLQVQQSRYAQAATAAEGEALAARISGELAARGEAQAAQDIYKLSAADQQREETRVAALHALMQMNPEKARPMLAKIVRGETEASAELRQNAVFILCQDDEQGLEIVLEALPTTTDPQLLEAMVMCLAQDESERSFDALTELMRRSDDPEVQQAILMSIGHRGDARSFDLLAGLATDRSKDAELRTHAMFGLMQSDDERVVDIALGLMNSPGEPADVQEMALMILARSDSPRAADALLELADNPSVDPEVRAMALFNAGMHGKIDVGRLRLHLPQHRQPRPEGAGLPRALADERPARGALDLLLEIVRTETDPEIRQNAIFWIGQFDDQRAADALMEIIEGKVGAISRRDSRARGVATGPRSLGRRLSGPDCPTSPGEQNE